METVLRQLRDPGAAAGDPSAVGARLLEDSLKEARVAERTAAARQRETRGAVRRVRAHVALLVLGFAIAVAALVAVAVLDLGLVAWVTGAVAVVGALGGYLQQWQQSRTVVRGALGEAAEVTRPFRNWRHLEAEQHERADAAARAAAHVQDLEAAAANPERLVGTYIQERLAADDYRQQLGLLGLVREDLGTLSKAVRDANDAALQGEAREGQELDEAPVPVVNRIVLFIDDLDRCPPSRVVEVLEAVHLLLAYELFVVVLAVDTRWLQQSLRTHYRGLLGGRASGAATAMDYIEKIVQMPFQLRPLTPDQVGRMITGLSSGGAADAGTAAVRTAPAGKGTPGAGTGEERADGGAGGATVPEPRQVPEASSARTAGTGGEPAAAASSGDRPAQLAEAQVSRVDLRPEGLVVSDHERDYLVELSALVGQTPRTVKRFVNTYRVLKARMPDPAGFAADSGPASDYRVAGLLLAVVVGLEDITPEVFEGLRGLSSGDPLGAALDRVHPTDPIRAEQRKRLAAWLDERHVADTPCAPYQEIAPVVARFSFTPLPA